MADGDERTAVYRLYGSDGFLMYVGITNDPDRRFKQHAADREWWPGVVDRQVDWYTRRCDAEMAEQAAIKVHAPPWNKEHSPEWPETAVAVQILPSMARALDLLRRALAVGGEAPSRSTVLFNLLYREVAARGLLGDRPCAHSGVPWPAVVSALRVGEACSCGRIITPDCAPRPPVADAA